MGEKIHAGISSEPLDIAAAYAFVEDPAHGAMASFIGMVRRTNLGKDVLGVSYDVYAPLAIKVLRRLCEKVAQDLGGKINIYMEHFHGRLDVGGVSVVIAVSTPHRSEAFAACRTLIEELKHSAPIWKQEHYAGGDSEWVQGHALCQHSQDNIVACDHDHEHGSKQPRA